MKTFMDLQYDYDAKRRWCDAHPETKAAQEFKLVRVAHDLNESDDSVPREFWVEI